MRAPPWRLFSALAAPAAALVGSAGATALAADGPDGGVSARVVLTCDRADGPGRVRCEAEARVEQGDTIAWGDVVIVTAPAFSLVLRGRIGPHDATVHEPDVWRWAFALVARDRGSGDVQARVRIVVCREKACVPEEIPVTGKLVVGG